MADGWRLEEATENCISTISETWGCPGILNGRICRGPLVGWQELVRAYTETETEGLGLWLVGRPVSGSWFLFVFSLHCHGIGQISETEMLWSDVDETLLCPQYHPRSFLQPYKGSPPFPRVVGTPAVGVNTGKWERVDFSPEPQ